MVRIHHIAIAWAAAAALAACGGGGSDTTPRAEVTQLKVMGDSLADVGTFGIKFTLQGADIYPERIAQSYGLSKGCNFYRFTGQAFAANPTPGCQNFAIGGGVINGASSNLTPADPRIISVQLATAVAAGNHRSGDLLLIVGGGNDAAALVTAYLRAGQPAPAGDGGAAYVALLSTQLSAAQVGAAVSGGANGLAAAGGQYMTALANTFFDQIKAQALDKGAQRVALLNMPGITNTPRFQAVLGGIGAAAGAAARTQSEALFKGWVEAFNRQLATRASGNSAVAVVDFYTSFNDQVANPAQFALTNVTVPACPVTGVGSDGLPTYTFPTCSAATLGAAPPPTGAVGTRWWESWAFSDGFHPSPYGHQLLAELISRTLSQAGWL